MAGGSGGESNGGDELLLLWLFQVSIGDRLYYGLVHGGTMDGLEEWNNNILGKKILLVIEIRWRLLIS